MSESRFLPGLGDQLLRFLHLFDSEFVNCPSRAAGVATINPSMHSFVLVIRRTYTACRPSWLRPNKPITPS